MTWDWRSSFCWNVFRRIEIMVQQLQLFFRIGGILSRVGVSSARDCNQLGYHVWLGYFNVCLWWDYWPWFWSCVFGILLPLGAKALIQTQSVQSCSAVKHCNFKLTTLLPARNTLQVIKQPYTSSSMVWLLLLLETVFVCLQIYCEETVQLMQFVPECCLAIEYIQYKIMSFPQESVQSVKFVDISSVPECCLWGITLNQKMVHAVDNKSW